jgi:hypothetical protein
LLVDNEKALCGGMLFGVMAIVFFENPGEVHFFIEDTFYP